MKKALVLMILLLNVGWLVAQITMSAADAAPSDAYNCQHLDLGVGPHPRISIDQDAQQIRIEYTGYPYVDVYEFQDTLRKWTDTLDQLVPAEEVFQEESGKLLNWLSVSSFPPLPIEDIDECLLNNEQEHQVLRVIPLASSRKESVLILRKGQLRKRADEYVEAHYFDIFITAEQDCTPQEACGAVFWGGLERIFITDIIHNDLPIILALESKDRFGEGKRLRIISSRITAN